MRKNLRHYMVTICTLLSLFGQGVISNGHTMVAVDNMITAEAAPTMIMKNMPDCHQAMMDVTTPTHQTSHCCDGSGSCSSDCSHCFTITFAASVLTTDIYITPAPVDIALAMPMTHFFSIDSAPAFRPPIV